MFFAIHWQIVGQQQPYTSTYSWQDVIAGSGEVWKDDMLWVSGNARSGLLSVLAQGLDSHSEMMEGRW